MQVQERHEMQLKGNTSTGEEEWFCPTCGRRFILSWPPEYKKIILERGDEEAAHSGSKGGLRIGAAQILNSDESALPDELRPWLKGLQDLGFDENWNQAA